MNEDKVQNNEKSDRMRLPDFAQRDTWINIYYDIYAVKDGYSRGRVITRMYLLDPAFS